MMIVSPKTITRIIRALRSLPSTDEPATIAMATESSLTPNMRALKLSMRAGDILLSMGVAASDVVNQCLTITDAYCKRRVHLDINSTMIMASQYRGVNKEPLTLFRTVKPRGANNLVVQEIEQLIRDIKKGLPLAEAEVRFKRLQDNPPSYPKWSLTVANACVNVGVVMLFTGHPVVLAITFVIGLIVDRLMAFLSRRGWPGFFVQVGAAMFITFSAAAMSWLGEMGFQPYRGLSPTLIIVGGIVMLVAGLTIVSTAQDAIDEFYLTASAKILKTFMNTAGIIVGILVALSITQSLGYGIRVPAESIPLGPAPLHITGAFVIAAAWAFYIQGKRSAVVFAGLIGTFSWIVYVVTSQQFSFSAAAASGTGAVLIGFLAAIAARIIRTPTNAIINGAIVPLVPGLSLYTSLMMIVSAGDNYSVFLRGLAALFVALSVALAIAAGATFGNVLGRPIPRSFIRARRLLSSSREDMA